MAGHSRSRAGAVARSTCSSARLPTAMETGLPSFSPGGGSDGALGAKAVKAAGGVVLVQDPREATHDGMPRAVIAAEVADVVLPVRELANRLAGGPSRTKTRCAPFARPS